jgi:hypothetical protein
MRTLIKFINLRSQCDSAVLLYAPESVFPKLHAAVAVSDELHKPEKPGQYTQLQFLVNVELGFGKGGRVS